MRKQGIFELLLIELGKVLNKALLWAGFSWQRTLRPAALEWFVASLRPVASGHDLTRIGAKNAGGYLVPDDLDGIGACLSAGLSPDGGFERLVHEKLGIEVHVADSSAAALPVGLGGVTLIRRTPAHRDSKKLMSLETWLDETDLTDAGDDLILRLDTGGWGAMMLVGASMQELRRFRMIILRAQGMDRILFNRAASPFWSPFGKLLPDFAVVHIHADNTEPVVRARGVVVPQVMEFTFLRRDRLIKGGADPVFPHPLDAPSDPTRKDIVLPALWQSRRDA